MLAKTVVMAVLITLSVVLATVRYVQKTMYTYKQKQEICTAPKQTSDEQTGHDVIQNEEKTRFSIIPSKDGKNSFRSR